MSRATWALRSPAGRAGPVAIYELAGDVRWACQQLGVRVPGVGGVTLTLVAALFLARDGFGAGRRARLWLLALWLGTALNLSLAGTLPPAVYAAPLLTATLGICAWRSSGDAR